MFSLFVEREFLACGFVNDLFSPEETLFVHESVRCVVVRLVAMFLEEALGQFISFVYLFDVSARRS